MSVWKKRISKSNFVLGCQCQKALWYTKHKAELRPAIDEKKQALFDQGSDVGGIARRLFPEGVLMPLAHYELEESHRQTIQFVKEGHSTIFEATACDDETELSARADILTRKKDKTWQLLEVKSSTKVKEEHLLDLAFQYYVFSKRNYKISELSIVYVNNEYSRDGEINPNEFLKTEDVTEKILAMQKDVQSLIENFRELVIAQNEPQIAIGSHCDNPYECDFKHHCWKDVPDYSVLNLFPGKGGWKIREENDSFHIEDLTKEQFSKKRVDYECYLKNSTHVDQESLVEFLDSLDYPLYFLDYETLSYAMPLFNKSKPYQQIPFQFSLHVLEHNDSELRHVDYLHTQDNDPRPKLIEKLVESCGDKGSILVYWKSFEESRNKELIDFDPSFKNELEAINARLVDLIIPFKKRFVYKPEQKSSVSIKNVLPAFTELSYDGLGITEGGMASLRYLQFVQGKTSQNNNKSFSDLREYCKLDTFAMVELLRVLERLVENNVDRI